MDTNQQQNAQQSLVTQWQSQQHHQMDQQRLLHLQSQSQSLMQPSDQPYSGNQLDASRFNPQQQSNQFQQSLQQLQQMQHSRHALTDQELQMSQQQQLGPGLHHHHDEQPQPTAQDQQQQSHLGQVRQQMAAQEEQERHAHQLAQQQQYSELEQFHFLQQKQSQQVLDHQQQMSLEEFQGQQLAAALEALRQQQEAGTLSEKEYQERALALVQELGLEVKEDGNVVGEIDGVGQQLGAGVEVGGAMDLRQQQEQQQMWHDEQQRVHEFTMRLLESNPQITEEELYQAISQHLLEANANWNGAQEPLDGVQQDQMAQPAFVSEKNLEELALQYNVDREQLQQALHGMHQGEPLNFAQQDLAAEALPQNPSEQQSRADDDLSSIDTEQQRAYEKKRDQNFARELRLFYKKLLDTLGRDALDKMSRQSEEICRQIDEAQRAYIGRTRQQKDQDKQRRAQEEKKLDGNQSAEVQDGCKAADASSSSSIPSIVGADNDADSAFHSQLYGPNSNIDPDAFIQGVLLQLQGHEELAKQFKRFLPDDDEDDKKSIERKYWQFRDQLQLLEAQNEKEINSQNLTPEQQQCLQEQSLTLLADMDALDCSGLLRNENGEVNSIFISQLKNDAFQMLFDLLRKYQTAKDTRCVQDALTLYGQKMMCVAEKYQKFLQIELSQPLEQQVHAGANPGEVDQQAMIRYQVERLGMNMKLMLSLIPQEVIDNYQVMSPSAPPHDPDSPDHDSPKPQNQASSRRPQLDNNLLASHEDEKAKGVEQGKNAKHSKSQTDRQSRLQRRQEAKDSKEKATKQSKPVPPSKQPAPPSRRGKQRPAAGRGKKVDDAAHDDEVVGKPRRGQSGAAAKDGTDDSASHADATSSNASEDDGASEEVEEEGEEEVEEEDEADGQDGKHGESEVEEKGKGKDNEEVETGRRRGAKDEVLEDDEREESSEEGGKGDDEGAGQVGKGQNEGKGGRAFQMKSIGSELQQRHPATFADLAKPEIQTFINLQKQLRSEEDWNTFIKLFCLYMEGVVGLKDFFALLDERFGNKIRADLKKELQDLIPTRGSQRRLQSDILKPWNDLENQKFEKIPDSSYYKIGAEFHLPICTAKLDPKNKGHYQAVLNERYLSLSMGSENFKCRIRNSNEDLIFKNEDEMYKFDTQIEMFRKCHDVVEQEIKIFEALGPKEKAKYEFPRNKFRPLMFYWEKKYKDAFNAFLHGKSFHRDQLIQLKEGLGAKLQDLQEAKYDQLSQFEDIFKKHFIKSLDHRNIQYKEFIRKFLNKQDQMKEIKHIAFQNQCSAARTWNQLKGGNCRNSSFYHSFGSFVKNDLHRFDPSEEVSDYPIDMKFVDKLAASNDGVVHDQDGLANSLSSTLIEKMPHARMVFRDKTARNIAIKILCLYIKFSLQLHANDRPRMTENLKQIIQNFLQVSEFSELYDQCCSSKPPSGIESLSASQIELMMSQDSLLYYVRRCERILKSKENPESFVEQEDVLESKPPVQQDEDSSQQNESSQEDSPDVRHKYTERVLRDKGDGTRQKSRPSGPEFSQSNRLRNPDDSTYLKKQINSSDYRKGSAGNQFMNVEPIKIQIQKSLEELRQDDADHALMLSKAHNSVPEQRHSQTEPKPDNATPALKSQPSPLKGSDALSGASDDDERRSVASEKPRQEQPMSQQERKSLVPDSNNLAKGGAENQDDGEAFKLKVQTEDAAENAEAPDLRDKEIKDEAGSPQKMSVSPEKQSPGLRRFPQKYEKLRIDHTVHQPLSGDQLEAFKKDAEEAMFLPFYGQKANAAENYSLLYAPSNVFIFLKLFYSLYERVLYAQTLVREKIGQDLAEMSVQDKIKYGICEEDSVNGQPDQHLLNDVFYRERYEYLLKGIFATTTQVSSQAQSSTFPGIGYTHGPANLMDHNKYEDFGRQLLGKNAFLLFQIDKIISQAVKQLQLMHTDHAYQKAKDLYKTLSAPSRITAEAARNEKARAEDGNEALMDYDEPSQLNDRLYLAHYAEQIVDQFSLKDCQNQSMGRLQESWMKAEGEQDCKHTLSKFSKHSHGLLQDGLRSNETGAGGQNAAAAAHSNFQVFRFLWSSKSQILAVHFIQLNPYLLPAQTTNNKHFKRIMQENYDYIQDSVVQPAPPSSSLCACHATYNRIVGSNAAQGGSADEVLEQVAGCPDTIDYGKRLHPPVFLKRSMKIMSKIRQKQDMLRGNDEDHRVQVNGLVSRIVPHLNQLTFDKEGEDIFIMRRKSQLKVAEGHKLQLRKQIRANQIRTKRLKQLE